MKSAAYCSPICRHATRNQVRRNKVACGLTMGRMIRELVPPPERRACVAKTLAVVLRCRHARADRARQGLCVSGCGLTARIRKVR